MQSVLMVALLLALVGAISAGLLAKVQACRFFAFLALSSALLIGWFNFGLFGPVVFLVLLLWITGQPWASGAIRNGSIARW